VDVSVLSFLSPEPESDPDSEDDSFATAVVGRVETGAAEMDRDGIEDGLDGRRPANRARLRRRIGNALEDFEDVPVRTLVFVRGHEI
jgi:hypothetical protein